MRPTTNKIIDDLSRITSMIENAGNSAIDDNDKRELSDILAYTCYEIRRKYELTSQYFFIAECSAHKKYDEEYDKAE